MKQREKRAFIVAGGSFDGFFDQVEEGDYIIAADKGYTYLKKLNIWPDLVIGDFDSSVEPDIDHKIVLPKEKDITDTGACLEYAKNLGYKKIIIYGGLGGRLSHTLANIASAEKLLEEGIEVSLKSKKSEIFLVKDSFSYHEKIEENFYVSIFSLKEETTGLNLTGLKYPLTNYTMKASDHIGVSNETMSAPFEISIKTGLLLVIFEKKDL